MSSGPRKFSDDCVNASESYGGECILETRNLKVMALDSLRRRGVCSSGDAGPEEARTRREDSPGEGSACLGLLRAVGGAGFAKDGDGVLEQLLSV